MIWIWLQTKIWIICVLGLKHIIINIVQSAEADAKVEFRHTFNITHFYKTFNNNTKNNEMLSKHYIMYNVYMQLLISEAYWNVASYKSPNGVNSFIIVVYML